MKKQYIDVLKGIACIIVIFCIVHYPVLLGME